MPDAKRRTPKISLYGFLLVTLFIGVTDAVFVWINTQSDWEKVLLSSRKEARYIESSFFVSLDTVATDMQAIATYVASDPVVARAFQAGKIAVANEGGGPGGAKAAVARARLLDKVNPGWLAMRDRFHARQLHFHLGPGSTSFLRLHRPEKFGDNMDTVRHTIVDANARGYATKGFETGRVYSGIRGVAPVFYQPQGAAEKIQVGAVEAGASFSTILKSLKQAFNAEFAVFLTRAHMEANMWPDFIKKRYQRTPPVGEFVLEATTAATINRILNTPQIQDSLANGVPIFFKYGEKYLCASTFDFKDYRNIERKLPDAVGRVLFWRDKTDAVLAFEETRRFNIMFAITAFFLVEILLLTSWYYASTRLRRLVRIKTADLERVNEALEWEIGERMRAQEDFESLFDNVPVGIYQSRPDGRYITVNKEMAALHGYNSPEEMIDAVKNISTDVFAHKKDYMAVRQEVEKSGEVREFQAQARRKDGSSAWTSRSFRRSRDLEGNPIFDGFVRDITAQKQFEELKEDIDRITRHDMRSPLVGIISAATLLEESPNLDGDEQIVVRLAKEKAYDALNTIGRALDLHKMEKGSYSLDLSKVDICDLFERIRFDTAELAKTMKSDLDIQAEGKDEGGCVLMADGPLCYAIFSNLVKNGLEAAAPNTPVTICTFREPGWFVTTIHNAMPIPEEIQDTFFEKYATMGKKKGTGLGTYSAKTMVEYQGGTIAFNTSHADGTTIEVRLPDRDNLIVTS